MSARLFRRFLALTCSAVIAAGCDETIGTDPTDPTIPDGLASLVIYLEMGSSSMVTGLVVEVSAPDLSSPIIANIPVVMGVGTGTVLIPAGSDRTITMSAFNDDGIKTHEGQTTIDVFEGTNPTVDIDLEPVFGDVPLTVALGSFVLTVSPNNAVLRIGDAVQLTATLLDGNGDPLVRTLTYGSTNPVVASTDQNGLVTGLVVGQADIVVSYGDVQDVATITVTDHQWAVVAVGERHVCGLDQDGAAFCWGANTLGQIGNGNNTDQLAPVAVSGGHVFASLTTGGLASCGITAAGDGWCWGRGAVLGDNNPVALVNTPVLVTGGHQWASIEMGVFHACGITVGGQTYCWGIGSLGRLGTGTTMDRDEPTLVAGGLSFVSVTAGAHHTCAVDVAGDGYCWGSGANGRRGDGTSTNSDVPVMVAGGHTWSTISAGGHHTCGVTDVGQARCWGYGAQGQIGYGGQGSPFFPWPVNTGLSFSSISAGARHSCGITIAGAGVCWGYGGGGQMGNGSLNFLNPTPVAMSGGLQFVTLQAAGSPWSFDVSQSRGLTCGLTVNGGAFCTGYNNRGQVGDGTGINRVLPTPVTSP